MKKKKSPKRSHFSVLSGTKQSFVSAVYTHPYGESLFSSLDAIKAHQKGCLVVNLGCFQQMAVEYSQTIFQTSISNHSLCVSGKSKSAASS